MRMTFGFSASAETEGILSEMSSAKAFNSFFIDTKLSEPHSTVERKFSIRLAAEIMGKLAVATNDLHTHTRHRGEKR